MRCATATELVSARLDGELDEAGPAWAAQAAALDRHLASCPSCRMWATRLEQLNDHLRAQPAEPVSDLSLAVTAAATQASAGRHRAMRTVLVGAAATVVAAVASGAAGLALLSNDDQALAVDSVVAPEPLGRSGVVYLTIRNAGPRDRLLAASSPVAATVSMHLVSQRDGLISMSPVRRLLCSAELVLAPAAAHLMLGGIDADLGPGDRFPLTLHFEHHDPVVVDVEVVAWSDLDDRLIA
jgi:copper(I)-binding protein